MHVQPCAQQTVNALPRALVCSLPGLVQNHLLPHWHDSTFPPLHITLPTSKPQCGLQAVVEGWLVQELQRIQS